MTFWAEVLAPVQIFRPNHELMGHIQIERQYNYII